MSDERIDIEVNDKVDANIPKKLRDIATAADQGANYVDRLKASLASINTSAVDKLSAANTKNTNSLTAQLNAQAKLQAQLDKSATAAANLALAEEKLATQTAKTQAAQAAATIADTKAAAAKDALAASTAAATAATEAEAVAQARIKAMVEASTGAGAAGGLAAAVASGPLTPAAAGTGTLAKGIETEAAAATAAVVGLESEAGKLASTTPGLFAKFKTGALTAFDAVSDFTTHNGGQAITWLKSLGTETLDAGVKIESAGGHIRGGSTAIRELLVIAREGANGNFTRMAGSVSILAGAIGVLKLIIPAAIAGVVALGAAKVALNTDAEQKSLKDYADSLGLTEKEMRKLSDTTVDASGKLKSHNDLQIQFGDIVSGVITTIKQGVASLADEWGITSKNAAETTQSAIGYMAQFFSQLAGGVYAFVKFIVTEAQNLFTLAWNAGQVAANAIFLLYAKLSDSVIDLFNGVGSIINTVSEAVGHGDIVGKIARLDDSVSHLGNGVRALKGSDFFADMRTGAEKTNAVLAKTGDNIRNAAQARIKAEADAIKANRNPTKGRAPSDKKDQGDYIDDTNKKLDDELSRMHLLKDARDEQAKLDQIEEEFQKRRMPLDAAQIAVFKAKIDAIQQYKYVQAEADKEYENINGPLRTYNAALAAANELVVKGAITQAQANQQIVLAKEAYASATDPLHAMKLALDTAELALGKFGDAAQSAAYYEQIRQAELAKGNPLDKQYVAGINAEVDALMKRNKALQAGQFVQSTVAAITNPLTDEQKMLANKKDMYAAIDKMRQSDELSEANAARAKYALDAKYSEMRLSAADSFFGDLATLSSSGNKKLAAIGKAAAIAQATIDGFMAVQKALATYPPPWSFVVAAGVAIKTAANVAGILSTNAGSFATGGQFTVNGKSGVDANNINMNVTNGERVTIETPAQQRASDGKGAVQVNSPTKVVNLFDEKSFIGAMDSDEGEKVIMNIIRRRRADSRQILGVSGK